MAGEQHMMRGGELPNFHHNVGGLDSALHPEHYSDRNHILTRSRPGGEWTALEMFDSAQP